LRLAGGLIPFFTEELALRARQLVEPRKRGELADALDHLVEIAERRGDGAARITPYPPFRPKQVEANRSLFGELARRLRGRGPHGLRGLAMTSLMREDSTRSLASTASRRRLSTLCAVPCRRWTCRDEPP
jgi:hypothetical protein